MQSRFTAVLLAGAAIAALFPLVVSAAVAAPSTICLTSSSGTPLAGATTQYYQNGWKSFGATGNDGCASGATLSGNVPVGINYGGVYNQQNHDFSANQRADFKTVSATVKLIDSSGAGIAGGSVQYYAAGWHQIGSTDGTGSVTTEILPGATPWGVTAGGIYSQKTQDPATDATVTFQTVHVTVKLVDSSSAGIAGGSAQYYANGWHQLGATDAAGTVGTELLPGATPFGMTAGGIYNQQTQDPSTSPVVTFQTVRTTVKLIDSSGAGIAGGSAQYYANGWHPLGATDATGAVVTELLPGATPFGMTSGGLYNQKTQDPSNDPTVTFQTVQTTVKLIDSSGVGIAGGSAQYYANGWHQLGATDATGAIVTELLPGATPFGMTAGGIYNQRTQDPATNAMVVFQTIKTTVKLLDSTGAGIADGSAQYYANGWHQLGATDAAGAVVTELLPGDTPFGMTAGGIYNQKTQNPATNPVVVFQTVRTTVKLTDSSGAGVAGSAAQYYANGWHELGNTDGSGGVVVELLPGETPFGMTAGGIYNQKTQDPAANALVVFQTIRTTVKLIDSTGAGIAGGSAQYYANGWHQLGTTDSSGAVVTELLPGATPFGMTAGAVYNQKTQDPASNGTVVFQTVLVTIDVVGSNGGAISGAAANYYANSWHAIGTTGDTGTVTVQLLPDNTPFNASLGNASAQVSQSTASNPFVTIKLAIAGAAPPSVHASIAFVSATDNEITWRIWPANPANLYFWDVVSGCTAQGGADCGQMSSGGAGRTTSGPVASSVAASAAGQGFLVTQPYKKDGDACNVTNTVTYGPADDKSGAETVTGNYECAGTPALGWPLLGVFFLVGVAGAGMVAHKMTVARTQTDA